MNKKIRKQKRSQNLNSIFDNNLDQFEILPNHKLSQILGGNVQYSGEDDFIDNQSANTTQNSVVNDYKLD